MAISTSRFFDLTSLAEASYVLFDKLKGDYSRATVENAIKNASDFEGRFSASQASAFVNHWEVIHHQPDTASGFSATLFKSTDPGRQKPYVLAIRGTAGPQDLIAVDFSDIVVDGLAIDQIVDLWNYWKQLAPGDPGSGDRGAQAGQGWAVRAGIQSGGRGLSDVALRPR